MLGMGMLILRGVVHSLISAQLEASMQAERVHLALFAFGSRVESPDCVLIRHRLARSQFYTLQGLAGTSGELQGGFGGCSRP